MENNLPIILAINAGTNKIGIAILENKELIFYGIKIIKKQKTSSALLRKTSKIIRDLIIKYQPTHLAIKKVVVMQKSAAMVAVIAEHIKSVASQNGLKVFELAPHTICQLICGAVNATKKDLAINLAIRYPELTYYTTWKNLDDLLYWSRLFDAIAAGVYLQDLIS